MTDSQNEQFIRTLQKAWRRERISRRMYQALAEHEKNPSRRSVLLKLAETEARHGQQWADRLKELGAEVPPDRDTVSDRLWRWMLVQSGTNNALKRIEDAEEDDTSFYED